MTNSADPDQKPTDLDQHCLLRQGMSCSARGRLKNVEKNERDQISMETLTLDYFPYFNI